VRPRQVSVFRIRVTSVERELLKVPRTLVETSDLERKGQWLCKQVKRKTWAWCSLARQAETLFSASGEAPFTYPTPLGWRTVGAPSSLYLELGVLIGIEGIHCRILNAGR